MQSSRIYVRKAARWNMLVENDSYKYSEDYNQKDTHHQPASLSSLFSLEKHGSKGDNSENIGEAIKPDNLASSSSNKFSRIRFLFCNLCFWCASYYHSLSNNSGFGECPACHNCELESMPLSPGEVYKFDFNPRRGTTLEFSREAEK